MDKGLDIDDFRWRFPLISKSICDAWSFRDLAVCVTNTIAIATSLRLMVTAGEALHVRVGIRPLCLYLTA